MRKIIKYFVRKIPREQLIRFSFLFSKIISVFYLGNKVSCPICEGKFRKFLPYGNKGDVNRLCPRCLSLERHRLLWLYLKNKTNFFDANLKVLHVAPEQPYLKRFKKLKSLDYTTADLVSPIADVKLDIQDIPFEDNTFDIVICNHVLEHVDDDIKAMKEFYRILKKGGRAFLHVPIDVNRDKTYEDTTITGSVEREKHFGQYDHLRVHGLDYPQRLESVGFTVLQDKYFYDLDKETVERFRLRRSGEEIIYLAIKK